MIRPRTTSLAALCAFCLTASATIAADEYNTSSGVTYAGVPLGLHGVDTVALSSGEGLVAGVSDYTGVHDGVSYYFASETAKAAFEADPQAYLPQFGGFCTLAVGLGKKFNGDPRYADVVDGKLYVFVNKAVFETYLKDKEGTIASAEARWPSIRSVPVSDL